LTSAFGAWHDDTLGALGRRTFDHRRLERAGRAAGEPELEIHQSDGVASQASRQLTGCEELGSKGLGIGADGLQIGQPPIDRGDAIGDPIGPRLEHGRSQLLAQGDLLGELVDPTGANKRREFGFGVAVAGDLVHLGAHGHQVADALDRAFS